MPGVRVKVIAALSTVLETPGVPVTGGAIRLALTPLVRSDFSMVDLTELDVGQ